VHLEIPSQTIAQDDGANLPNLIDLGVLAVALKVDSLLNADTTKDEVAATHRTKRPHRLQAWALEVEKRRGRNRAAVAVANKLARIIWAVSTRGVPFQPAFEE
jgi:hypothetical protein